MGKNWVGLCLFFWVSWIPIEHKVAWAEAYLHTKWHLSPFSRLATINGHRPKIGALCPFRGGELGSHLTVLPRMGPTSVPSGILMHTAL